MDRMDSPEMPGPGYDAQTRHLSAAQVRDRFGIPPEVEVKEDIRLCGSSHAAEPNPEITPGYIYGIGAHDARIYDTSRIPWHDGPAVPWLEAGEMHCIARRGANEMRARAFAAIMPTEPRHTVPVFHPYMPGEFRYTFAPERTHGVPAWQPIHDYDGWEEE